MNILDFNSLPRGLETFKCGNNGFNKLIPILPLSTKNYGNLRTLYIENNPLNLTLQELKNMKLFRL